MTQQQILDLQVRFSNFGFTPFENELKVSLISGEEKGRSMYVDALLPLGKLRFHVDLLVDVDDMTGNIWAYYASLQRNIEIPDTVIAGLSIKDLEARVRELEYIGDPFSKEAAEKKQALQSQFDTIGQLGKRNAKAVYELILAKYWNRFDFGERSFIIATRERVLNSFLSQIRIDLTKTERLTPWQAYLVLIESPYKEKKRK